MIETTIPKVIFSISRYAILDYEAKGFYCEECSREPERRFVDNIEESIGRKAYDEGFCDGRNYDR
jgi:hypothetical protein